MTTIKEMEFDTLISELRSITTISRELEKEIKIKFQNIYDVTKVPVLEKQEDLPYSENDFQIVYCQSSKNLCLLNKLIGELINTVLRCKQCLSHEFVSSIGVQSIVLAAQYNNSDTEWGSTSASNSAKDILSLLLLPNQDQNITGVDLLEGRTSSQSIEGVLSSKKETSSNGKNISFGKQLKPLLQYLSNNFVKETWKSNPGAREVYLWLLYILPVTELSENLGYLLPGALMMLEDWEQRHKIAAMRSLSHILQSVAGSELRLYGRATVIYKATKHQLYTREPELLSEAYPVAIEAAAVAQADPSSAHTLQMTAPEEVLSLLLQEMAYEQRLDRRKAFANSLAPAVQAAGLYAVRWFAELMEVITNYLAIYDGENSQDRIQVLKAAETLVKNCWCQTQDQATPLLSAVLRLLYDLPSQDCTKQAKEDLVSECCNVVELLCAAHSSTCRELCHGLADVDLPKDVRANIDKVFVPVFAST